MAFETDSIRALYLCNVEKKNSIKRRSTINTEIIEKFVLRYHKQHEKCKKKGIV